jgi:hypothetical protein
MPDGSRMILSIKLCRDCRKTSREVRFPPMSKHRCTSCGDAEKLARADRIAARGPRVATAPRDNPGDNPRHRSWIKSLSCAVRRTDCSKVMHPHHVRNGTGAGTALLPGDEWCVPLCMVHHDEGHNGGWKSFELKYGIDLRRLAEQLAARSPHIRKTANV